MTRILWFIGLATLTKLLFFSSAKQESPQIRRQGVLDLVAGSDRLDVQKHDFLQVRIGRDERQDMFSDVIESGIDDFWERFQKPLCVASSFYYSNINLTYFVVLPTKAQHTWTNKASFKPSSNSSL